jgi:uncharacterized spore protein YtfJ
MNLREARDVIDTMAADPDASRVFGQPYETADGTTVVPVAKLRSRFGPGVDDPRNRLNAKPLGIFVVKDGKGAFVPAADATKIAMMGILVGLVSATLAGVAMVRRPPWPDLHGEISPSRWRARPLR